MTVQTAYEHIAIDENKVPFIDGTPIKVVELVLDHKAYGWSPEEPLFPAPRVDAGPDPFRTGLLLGPRGRIRPRYPEPPGAF